MMGVRSNLVEGANKIKEALNELNAVIAKRNYTINEMKSIRSKLLQAVRYNIDPSACGHMPEERHY